MNKKDIKMKKKEIINEIKFSSLKTKIELLKIELDRLVEAIVEYCFIENSTTGPYFKKLFQDNQLQYLELLDKKPEEEKIKTSHEYCFGKPKPKDKPEEEYYLEKEIKYLERQIAWAKNSLDRLDKDKKKEIIIDGIKQKCLWSDSFYWISEITKTETTDDE